MATTLLMLLALSFLPQSTRTLTAHTIHLCAGSRVWMCSCRSVLQPIAAAERASVVVRGTVIALRDSVLPLASGPRRVIVTVAHVRVSTNWKQAPVDSVVHVGTSSDTCAYPFKVGKDYLIYASVAGQLAMPTTRFVRALNRPAAHPRILAL